MNALRSVAAFLAVAGALAAQPVVAPTPDRPSDLLTLDDFTVTNSFEVGYRFSSVGGNRDVYRSAVNYGNGIRLLEGELRMNSKDGRGALFDELAWRTTGAGGDRIRASTLTVEKNRLWRYDMRLRIVNYFNRLPSLWNGEHGLDSERILQAHDLTLLPGTPGRGLPGLRAQQPQRSRVLVGSGRRPARLGPRELFALRNEPAASQQSLSGGRQLQRRRHGVHLRAGVR